MKRIKLKMLGVIIALVMVMGVILSGLNVSEAGVVTSKKKSFSPYIILCLGADMAAGLSWNSTVNGDTSTTVGKMITGNYIDYDIISQNNYNYIRFFDDENGDGFYQQSEDSSDCESLSWLNVGTATYVYNLFANAAGYDTTDTVYGDMHEILIETVGDDNATLTFSFSLVNSSTGSFSGVGKAGHTYYATYQNGTWDYSEMPSDIVNGDSSTRSWYPYDAEFLGLSDFGYSVDGMSDYNEYWDSFKSVTLTVTTSSNTTYYFVGVYDPDFVNSDGESYSDDSAQSSVTYMLLSEEAFDDYEFSTELEYDANYQDGTNAGGTLTDGTYYPNQKKVDDISITYPTVDDGSYYAELQEKYESLEPTVTATIKSKTDEGIVSTNEVAMNTDGTANSEGWYYPDTTDTTVIAKDYLFATYNNDEDNGIVKNEKVALVGENGGEDEQTVSITWPFRIVDEIYKENDDGSTTVTIVTNLPMDPDQIEDGWKYIDGSDYHEIRKTYAAGEDVDEDVTVYQNETGETDETTVQIDAEEEATEEKKDEADEDFLKTGESVTIGVLLVIAIALGVVIYRKKKNIYNK